MDRQSLKSYFTLGKPSEFACPTCSKGVLRHRKNTFVKDEVSGSRDHSKSYWEPEWIQYVYTCVLDCDNPNCKETVMNCGIGNVQSAYGDYNAETGMPDQEYSDCFFPKFFVPHLELIPIPTSCPDSVSEPLRESFRLFFSSPAAAANNVRIAIEELLTELRVKRSNVSGGKRHTIALHRRIVSLPPKYSAFRDPLLAIKWLGNAGSHGTKGMTHDDVMDAFELTEHILEEIYMGKSKRLADLTKKINKRKGPVN